MTQSQFDALATLLRLRPGASKDAAAQVLVHGQRVGAAAAQAGITSNAVTNAVARCRAGLALAQVAALAAS